MSSVSHIQSNFFFWVKQTLQQKQANHEKICEAVANQGAMLGMRHAFPEMAAVLETLRPFQRRTCSPSSWRPNTIVANCSSSTWNQS